LLFDVQDSFMLYVVYNRLRKRLQNMGEDIISVQKKEKDHLGNNYLALGREVVEGAKPPMHQMQRNVSLAESRLFVSAAIQARSDKEAKGVGGDDRMLAAVFKHPKFGESLLIVSLDGVSEGGNGHMAATQGIEAAQSAVSAVARGEEAFENSLSDSPQEFCGRLALYMNGRIHQAYKGARRKDKFDYSTAGAVVLITEDHIAWAYAGDERLELISSAQPEEKRILEVPQNILRRYIGSTEEMTPSEISQAVSEARQELLGRFIEAENTPQGAAETVDNLEGAIDTAFGQPRRAFEKNLRIGVMKKAEFASSEVYGAGRQVVLLVGSDGTDYCSPEIEDEAVLKKDGAVKIVSNSGDYDDKHVVLIDISHWAHK